MASWCRDSAYPEVVNAVPGNHFELADQTASTTGQSLATPAKFFRAIVYLKSFTVGTGQTVFNLIAADNSGLSTNKRNIGSMALPIVAGVYCFTLDGFTPDATKLFVGIVVTFGTGASGTYDAIIDAV
jgi:hypothetical protein